MTGKREVALRHLGEVPVRRTPADQVGARQGRVLRSVPVPGDLPSATGSGSVEVAAWALFCRGDLDAGERLVREHRPDRHGRCHGCPHSNTLAPRFPCVLRLIGEATARLYEQRGLGPGPGPRGAA